jgi:HEPN domain-containing protein
MKDETAIWLRYANENLESARVLLDSSLFNPCLQNVQQCIEKLLKALLVELSVELIKTHSISRLKQKLMENGASIPITDEECDLLDTIYLPSKYPISSVIPEYNPDETICRDCIDIATRVNVAVNSILKK